MAGHEGDDGGDGVPVDGVVGVHHLAAPVPGQLGGGAASTGGAVQVLETERIETRRYGKNTWTDECG